MEICSQVRQKDIKNYTKHELFSTWRMMNYRCYSDVHKSFPTYGGMGIYVCPEWRWDNSLGFFNFIRDVSPRPDKHTLDREDPYGIYSKENCRWADKKTQQNNFRKETKTESGHLGVLRDSANKKWVANIQLRDKPHCINTYSDLASAIEAREEALKIKTEQGEEACLLWLESNKVVTVVGKRFYGRKTSKYYGVSWHRDKNCWRAVLARKINGKLKQVFLGQFLDEEDANKAVIAFLEKEKNESSI